MKWSDEIDPAPILDGDPEWIDPETLDLLAKHPLSCVDRPFPHQVWAVDDRDEEVDPTADHPVFFGCFDWHSAVHGHWNLVRQLRLFPEHPDREAVVASISERFSSEGFEAETAVLEQDPSFGKPYGWGWLLRLAAELELFEGRPGTEWRSAIRPLEERVRELVLEDLLEQPRPFRVGTHQNTAFALQAVLDYAGVTGDEALANATRETAREFYSEDRTAPVDYEPLSLDFLSPALVEADLMRRVLDEGELVEWCAGFFANLDGDAPVLTPVDPGAYGDDGLALHFIGLNLSRAWCLADLAAALGDDHPLCADVRTAACRHIEAGLADAMTDTYAGSHWLSSFAMYLLSRRADGIASP